ncbi:MAG: hypothetical protein KC766_17260 [Myxococcales bacterium]|nr:hypothetical protein [Myxococcales bacterium]
MDYLQGVPTKRPSLVGTAIGGLASVRFSGSPVAPQHLDGTGLSTSNGLTVFVVAKLSAVPSTTEFLELFDNAEPVSEFRLGFTSSATYGDVYFGAAGYLMRAILPASDDKPHLLEVTWSGADPSNVGSYSLWQDGNAATLANTNSAAVLPKSSSVGLNLTTSATFRGDVGELVVYSQVLAAADHNALHDALRAKWGLP